MKSFNVLSGEPKVGDDVLIHEEIVRVTGLEHDKLGQLSQVIVERQGETFSISPFEYSIVIVEWQS